jgi:L-malate glycosyltransferase
MKPANILHLHSSFNLGGKEARAIQLMHHFSSAARHSIISAVPEALGARSEIKPEIRAEFPGQDRAPVLYGKPSPGRYWQLAHYMEQFDLVLSYNWGAMDGVMAHRLLAPFMKLPPLIHHEDGFNEDEAQKLNWKRNAFRRQALKGAHALVVPSQLLHAVAQNSWKMPQSRLHHIPNGIDLSSYRQGPAVDAFPGLTRRRGEIVVGTIAGLRKVKNLPRLVRAVAAAGSNLCLAIAGEGPERGAITQEAAQHGLTERLLMPGFLSDPARYIGLFDIFALSSDSEQFPISLVEAMAAGLPVLSTDVGDVRNMVAAENLPFIIEKGDEDAFASALQQLSSNAALRSAIGHANQVRAMQEYGEAKMFACYQKLYGNAMKRTDFARQS